MLFIIYLSYFFLNRPLLEARAEIQKYFRWFLVQIKSLEFSFEINWPLAARAIFFVRFLEELKIPKSPFEINWPSDIENKNKNAPWPRLVSFQTFRFRNAQNNIFFSVKSTSKQNIVKLVWGKSIRAEKVNYDQEIMTNFSRGTFDLQ